MHKSCMALNWLMVSGVSERGPWVSTDFNKAYQRFKFGDLTTALLYYIKLAEIG